MICVMYTYVCTFQYILNALLEHLAITAHNLIYTPSMLLESINVISTQYTYLEYYAYLAALHNIIMSQYISDAEIQIYYKLT